MSLQVAIVGGSGYTGGELIRLLLQHPEVELTQVTSERWAGKPVSVVHPNLRHIKSLAFTSLATLEAVDVLFLCLPHGQAMLRIDELSKLAPTIIDLSSDFRLDTSERYCQWYTTEHARPDLLSSFVYGVPELNRGLLPEARRVTGAGCNATAIILGLLPIAHAGLIDQPVICEVKVSSSQAGASANEGSHHPLRSGCLRSFQPTGHRHTAEVEMALGSFGPMQLDMSATAVDQVRGVLATSHVTLKDRLNWREILAMFREFYKNDPFIRLISQRQGIHRVPEPKYLAGSNFCDIALAVDERSGRLVIMSAIDNLMKGAAGQAVQCLNIMMGFDEQLALTFPGLSPV